MESYDIVVDGGRLEHCGAWAGESLGATAGKIAIISNPKVYGLYGDTARKSLESSGFNVCVFLTKDGERFKNLSSLEDALEFMSTNNLARNDAVIALGGGVVGDLAGFAASVYMRGIAFLQIPTTLLAMIDSSVGGKTAINTQFGKNLVGTFYQPKGVLIDVEMLKTLAVRELTAGFCECVKQGAISGRKLFDLTGTFLEDYPVKRFKAYFDNESFIGDLEKLVKSQVEFKASVVRQDELEDIERIDPKSRKILNFGHTLAHALEKATNYRYFKHGEAVGYGILFAAEISKRLDFLDKKELILLYDVIRRTGILPDVSNIDAGKIFAAFKFDKKSTGKSFHWILLQGIGEPVILSDHLITQQTKEKAFDAMLMTLHER